MADTEVFLTAEQQNQLEVLISELDAARQSTDEVAVIRPIPWPIAGGYCLAPIVLDAEQLATLAETIAAFRRMLDLARAKQPVTLALPKNVSGRFC